MDSRRSSLRIANAASIAVNSPANKQSTTNPDLMRRITDFLYQGKFSEVQDLLLEHENDMKIEKEQHKKTRESLEKTRGLLELERSKSKKDNVGFDKVNEEGEHSLNSDELFDVYLDEESEILKKNGNLKLMNEENNDVGQLLESDKFVEVLFEKSYCFNVKVSELEKEIEGLKGESLLADEKLRSQSLEASETLQQLKKLLSEADIEKTKSDETIEQMRDRLYQIDGLALKLQEIEMRCPDTEDSLTVGELKRRLLVADSTIEGMKTKILEVDSLNVKVQELESEIEQLKEERSLDLQTMEEMRCSKIESSQTVDELKKQLIAQKKKSSEIVEDMTCKKRLEMDSLSLKLHEMDTEITKFKEDKFKDSKTIKDLWCRLYDAEGIIQDLTNDKLEAKKAAEGNTRLVPGTTYVNTKFKGTDIIEINDSDDDEEGHCRSVKTSGLSVTNVVEKESCNKVVSLSHTMSPCTSGQKRKRTSPGNEVGK